MADKNIKIRALLDTQGFDQEVNRLQQKLKDMQKTGEGLTKAQTQLGGEGTMMGKYAKTAFGEFSKESKRDLEAMFASQKREAMQQSIQMKGKQAEMQKMAQIEGTLTKGQQQRVNLLEKEIRLLQQRNQATIVAASKTKEQLGALGGAPPEGAGPAGAGAGDPQNIFKNLLRSIGISALVKGALDSATHVIERERKTAVAQGQAARVASTELREQFQGQGARGIFWAAERQKAMRMASEEQRAQGGLDIAKVAGGIGAGAVTGGMLGGPMGAVAGGIVAGVGMMGNERLRSRVFDQEQYRALMTKEGMQKYQANLAAQKAMQPRRAMAQEYFERNAGRMQTMQRQLGLQTDEGLLGAQGPVAGADLADMISNVPQARPTMGWERRGRGQFPVQTGQAFPSTGRGPLEGGIQADTMLQNILAPQGGGPVMQGGTPMGRRSEGYLIDQMMGERGTAQYSEANIMRQRQQLLAGGGGTDVQGLAGGAARMERNIGLMGAGGIMGRIAGAGMGQGAEQTEENTKRLLAEAVRIGVDLSKMPVELQRFTQATAEVMTQGGGISGTAAARLGAGLGGLTSVEVEAGKGAYQEALQAAKGAGGMEGQIGYGFLMGKETQGILGKEAAGKLGKSAELLNSLNQLSVEDLERDPSLLKGLAKRLGVGEDKLKDLIQAKDAKKQSRTAGLEEMQKVYAKKTEGMSLQEKAEFDASEEGAVLYSKLQTRRAMEKGGFLQKGAAARKAGARMGAAFQMDLGGEERLRAPLEAVEAGLKTEPDTAAIAQEKAMATGDVARIRALRDNIEDLKNAAKAHSESAEMYNQQFNRFIDAVKSGGNAMETMKGQLDSVIEMLAEKGFVAAAPSD